MVEIRAHFLTAIAIILAILLILILFRAIKGPRATDRIIAVNMMGTITMAIIGILVIKMQEGYLADVALIYALISFLAVVVFARVYLGVYNEGNEEEKKETKEN